MTGISGAGRSWAIVLGAMIALAWQAGPAEASSANAGSSMLAGGPSSQPIGHYEFCKRKPDECAIRPRELRRIELTDELLETIARVNLTVNENVTAMTDLENYGQPEFWSYPDHGYGDCEDHALEKRRMLMNKGISLSNLLITVVRLSNGEGHAILTVRTDRGDFILDNLSDEVLLWTKTGYEYLKRQDSRHTGRWVSLEGGNHTLVGAVR
jgi:predicted transglutaminase-like cysteine proteinase